MITIEKNVPPPMAKSLKATISKMEAGDSILLPSGNPKIRNILSRYTRLHKDKVFTSATEVNGLRVWRLE